MPISMLNELLPFNFELNPVIIAGVGLWSLALYLGLSPASEWVTTQLSRWFNFAERSLYTSAEEFERTRRARESLNGLYASIFSIVPFLLMGGLCDYLIELSLGRSWAVSMGILVCISCGIYELGRRNGQASK
ncbi:MAG: hypothetical protein WCA35_27925 [Kovacikia sp.]